MSSEVKYMHVNPYMESGDLPQKVEDLDRVDKDNIETIIDIGLAMDYVDDMQMKALMSVGKEGGSENNEPSPDSVEGKLKDTFNDAMSGFDDLEEGLGDE